MTRSRNEKGPEVHTVHTCPWWIVWTFDNPLRRVLHRPEDVLEGLVGPGQAAIDVGCGAGHFTIGLARLVGDQGRVTAVDLQEKMLERVRRRAKRAGLEERIRMQRCGTESLGLTDPADFILAFWMVHETADQRRFLTEVRRLLKPGGRLLIAEPVFHVTGKEFEKTIGLAAEAGLRWVASPGIRFSRTALFGN